MAKLGRRDPVTVLLYGGKSCPHCGRMREAYAAGPEVFAFRALRFSWRSGRGTP